VARISGRGVVRISGTSTIDPNEERRLLYVAMTRAREYLYLTMARRRFGATARSGGGVLTDRQRCPFFEPLGISPEDGWKYLLSVRA